MQLKLRDLANPDTVQRDGSVERWPRRGRPKPRATLCTPPGRRRVRERRNSLRMPSYVALQPADGSLGERSNTLAQCRPRHKFTVGDFIGDGLKGGLQRGRSPGFRSEGIRCCKPGAEDRAICGEKGPLPCHAPPGMGANGGMGGDGLQGTHLGHDMAGARRLPPVPSWAQEPLEPQWLEPKFLRMCVCRRRPHAAVPRPDTPGPDVCRTRRDSTQCAATAGTRVTMARAEAVRGGESPVRCATQPNPGGEGPHSTGVTTSHRTSPSPVPGTPGPKAHLDPDTTPRKASHLGRVQACVGDCVSEGAPAEARGQGGTRNTALHDAPQHSPRRQCVRA